MKITNENNMIITNADITDVHIVSEVLIEAAKWLDSIGQSMWKEENITVAELLKRYQPEEMKLCYEKDQLIGVYVLQWYDPLFWGDLKYKEAGILHKLAVCRDYAGMGYGRKMIESAVQLCKEHGVGTLRLNCGTFRNRLRNFYESCGFELVDRVYIDDRDQCRYIKNIQ